MCKKKIQKTSYIFFSPEQKKSLHYLSNYQYSTVCDKAQKIFTICAR